ncbi:hypothetical protein GPALN_004192 [Globodera pallida]|nr:hypothetical protein GPALN_004192 [Globodera pallida]
MWTNLAWSGFGPIWLGLDLDQFGLVWIWTNLAWGTEDQKNDGVNHLQKEKRRHWVEHAGKVCGIFASPRARHRVNNNNGNERNRTEEDVSVAERTEEDVPVAERTEEDVSVAERTEEDVSVAELPSGAARLRPDRLVHGPPAVGISKRNRHLPRVNYIKLNRWERERQIGSKVLGHWLNQIRKTRKQTAGAGSAGSGAEAPERGVRKRFLMSPLKRRLTHLPPSAASAKSKSVNADQSERDTHRFGSERKRVEEVEEEPNDQQQQQAPALLLVFARFLWTERVALLLLLILVVLLAQYGYWHSVL